MNIFSQFVYLVWLLLLGAWSHPTWNSACNDYVFLTLNLGALCYIYSLLLEIKNKK